jgi:hypothetical protein
MLSVPTLSGSVRASVMVRSTTSVYEVRSLPKLLNKGERGTYGGPYTRSDRADTCRLHRADIRKGHIAAHIWRVVIENALEPNVELTHDSLSSDGKLDNPISRSRPNRRSHYAR